IMHRKALPILIVGLLIAADAPVNEPPPKAGADKEMLGMEGTWKVIASELSGRKLDERDFRIQTIIVRARKITLKTEGLENEPDPFTVDPSKDPKAINLVNPQDKTPIPAIYSRDGKEMKICMPVAPENGKDLARPTSFETKGKSWMLLVLRRQS